MKNNILLGSTLSIGLIIDAMDFQVLGQSNYYVLNLEYSAFKQKKRGAWNLYIIMQFKIDMKLKTDF